MSQRELIECPACGEVVTEDDIDKDYKVCMQCMKSGGWICRVGNVNSGPPDDDDEPNDQDATPLVVGDDPDANDLPEPTKGTS